MGGGAGAVCGREITGLRSVLPWHRQEHGLATMCSLGAGFAAIRIGHKTLSRAWSPREGRSWVGEAGDVQQRALGLLPCARHHGVRSEQSAALH